MEQYECKRLDLDALHLVYREHLTPDFPPAERKPLSAMEKLLSAGRYEPWGLYRGEELMAYALLWRDPEGGFVLLDCQQTTPHMVRLGAREIPRAEFVDLVRRNVFL